MNDKPIIESVPHGQHITLTCRNHRHLRWSTKNIAPIGCRRIFFDLMSECTQPECACPVSDLIPLDNGIAEVTFPSKPGPFGYGA